MNSLYKPCIRPRGPKPAPLMIVGEAPGEQEQTLGLPFVGPTGQLLTKLLKSSGINHREIYYTNVLYTRPLSNNMENFYVAKKDLPLGYPYPPVRPGSYLHPDLTPELDRLHNEVVEVCPNLILALGGTACWALLGTSAISKVRGTINAYAGGSVTRKVLPTFHPAYLFQDWSKRVVVQADLLKAKEEMKYAEIRRPERRIVINPTAEEVIYYINCARVAPSIAVDVETKHRQITVFGVAWSASEALTIPFWDSTKPDGSYWSAEVEPVVWGQIKDLLENHPHVIFQNGLYDLQYLVRMGIRVPGARDDTMLMHHALYPELPKGLGFLGSVHTNEINWKQLRARGDHSNKRDE